MYFNVKEDTYKKNSKLTGSGASVHRSFFHTCFRCKCRNHRFGAFKSNPFAKTGDEKGNVTGTIIQVSMTLANNTFVQNSEKILLGFAVQNLFWNAESVSMEQFQTRMNSSTDSVYLKF